MTQQPTPVDLNSPSSDEAGSSIGLETPTDTRTPLFQANSAARYQRQTMIAQIESRSGRRLTCYVSGSECIINENDTMPFVDLLHNVRPGERVELMLHTRGGSIDAAEKLVRMVRSKVGEC